MKNNKTKLIIIAAILLILFIGYKSANGSTSLETSNLFFNEIEYIAMKKDISVSVKGSGSVYPPDKRTVKSEIDGTVEKIYVSEGEQIENNEMLISLKSNSGNNNQIQANEISLNIENARKHLNELYDKNSDLNIYAESSGVVSGLNIKEGQQVSLAQNICTIKDTDNAYIETHFNKEQYEKTSVGDEVSVFLSKYFATESGVVYHIDSTPIALGGGAIGYKAVIKINNPGGYSVGDTAQVTIINLEGSFINMNNGKIMETKENIVLSAKNGKVSSVNAKNGMYVNEGDIILKLEEEDIELKITEQRNLIEKYQAQLNDLKEGNVVYSPMRGTVLNIAVSEDEVVGRTAALMTIADLDKMEVVLAVDELDITKIELGQEANISSDVFTDKNFTGSVSKISMEGKNQNGVTTYDVTIFINDRKDLMYGMNVDIEILADSRNEVLVLPVEAINKLNGHYMVTVKDESGNLSDVPVKLGLANKDFAEIISGINEGTIVVYSKQDNSIDLFNGGSGIMRLGR